MVLLNSSLLIVENSLKNSTKYQNYLRSASSNYNLSIVASIAEGLELCRTSPIDTVLLGGSISTADGLAFLELLAEQIALVGVVSLVENRPSVVMVASDSDARIAVRALKLGAQDYLLERDLTPELLHSAIEQARLKLQLQESRDRFRIAIDNVLDCTTIFSAIRDETGRIIDFRFDYLNPSALASNQMTTADMGRGLCEMFPSVRETGLFVKYCRVVETGEPLVQDNWIYSDTFGTQYLTKAYDTRIVKLDDGFIASWRDITEAKQQAITLQASEERLRLTIEVAKLGTVDVDLLTGQVIWNPIMKVLMGYEPGTAATYIYADFEARVHPEDRANVTADLARVTIDRPDSTSEFRSILPDGNIFWLRKICRFYYDDDGRAVRMLGTIEDITVAKRTEGDRKQAELALQASEQRYKALIDITAQIVWNADADGTILNSNSGAFTGQSLEELQGWGWMEAIHPDDRERTSELWWVAVRTLTTYEIEHRVRRYDREYRLMSVRAVPLFDTDGNVCEWVGLHTDITEVRQAEEKLRQAQALAQSQLMEIEAIYQTAPIGLTILDRDLRYQRISERLAEINGVTIEDHIGRTVREIVPDLANEIESLLRRVLETGEPVLNLEISGETSAQQGIYRTWIQNYYPLKDETGQSVGINAVVEEITDRKIVEAALLESEEQFRSTFEQAAVGIAHVGLDGRWLSFNQKLCDIIGYMEVELLDLTFQDITHPEDLAIDLEYVRQLLEGERPEYMMEKRYIHKLGHIVWVNLTVSLRLDAEGVPLHFISVIEAIDDRKQTELALLESERKFSAIFNQTFEFIGLLSLDGVLLEANQAALDSVGTSRGEIIGKHFWETPWWTHSSELQQQLRTSIDLAAQGEFISYEVSFPDANGESMTTNFSLKPVRDELDRVTTLVAEGYDVTERKQLELDLQAQTIELTKTTALVELRNQELNRFSHTVSHDLKAPLRGISNLAGWIQEDLPKTVDPDILTNLELMRSRVSRMDSLIDGLLYYAKVGNTEASLETFSVETLLKEIVDSLSIPDSFVVELPAELPPITTNRVLLSQVLANLIGNAYKHHDSPGETLRECSDGRIQVTVQPDNGIWRFSVIDDGCGIAPENQERIFDIFKTLSGTDKNSTGIGLSIVKKLVETQGGEITLESQLGMGTTFSFTWMTEI